MLATLHIDFVNFTDTRHIGMLVTIVIILVGTINLRRNKIVLRHRNLGMHGSRLVGFIIESFLLDNRLEQ